MSGEIDIIQIAKQTLTDRGHDTEGMWVGFDKAKQLLGL